LLRGIARCVRRAFLCGKDPLTGYDFEHRRQWIVDRLHELSSVFAIDLCAYAVMNNHYHVALRVNLEQAAAWTDEEVAAQWCRLFRGPDCVQRWMKGCMAYVDLNPIRAAIAQTPEQSDSTSIKERIDHPDEHHLRPFSDTADEVEGIPFTFRGYLELVDWAGRGYGPAIEAPFPIICHRY
jgi:hypothetical protein